MNPADDNVKGNSTRLMACSEAEVLLAEYVDGTLGTEDRAAVEHHLAECSVCAELAHDAAGAVAFMERAAVVNAPPELVTKLLSEISNGPSRAVVKPSLLQKAVRRLFGKWMEPVLQPRFAMGMAMTVLSFAMLGRIAGIEMRQLKPADLDPVTVWTSAEDRVVRVWEKGVKYYQNLRLVFEIQTRLKEWTEEPADHPVSTGDAPRPAEGERK
jgi:anti-sigma factor RsiW